MKKIDTIVVAPHFYTMEGAGVGYHSDAAMAVDGGKSGGAAPAADPAYGGGGRPCFLCHIGIDLVIVKKLGHFHTLCHRLQFCYRTQVLKKSLTFFHILQCEDRFI